MALFDKFKIIHVVISAATIIGSGFFTLGFTYNEIQSNINTLEAKHESDKTLMQREFTIYADSYTEKVKKLEIMTAAQAEIIARNREEIGILKAK